MRFVRYRNGNAAEGLAIEANGTTRGLTVRDARFPGDLDSLLRKGRKALEDAAKALAAGGVVDLAKVAVLPPVHSPEKIICIGLNYTDHSTESGFKQPDFPTLFTRFNSSLIGHGAPIVRPRVSHQLDYEGELAVILGKGGRHIPSESGLDHVAGYSIFNDGSIRDYQFRTPQWTIGKNFDDTGAFGPSFVTADEVPPGANGLKLQTRLNGAVVQEANTRDMVFDVATLIALLSEAITLSAGDLIVAGTPSGVGVSRKPQLFMKPGDLVEVEIEKLGVLSNPIVDEAQ